MNEKLLRKSSMCHYDYIKRDLKAVEIAKMCNYFCFYQSMTHLKYAGWTADVEKDKKKNPANFKIKPSAQTQIYTAHHLI